MAQLGAALLLLPAWRLRSASMQCLVRHAVEGMQWMDTANYSHLDKRQAVNASSRNEAALPEGLKHGAAGLYEGPGGCTTLALTACRLAKISK